MVYKKCIHPGRVLRIEYLAKVDMTFTEVALCLRTSRPQLSLILNEKAGISALMAIKLAKAFGTSAEYWLSLQNSYDLAKVSKVSVGKIKVIGLK